MARRRSESPAAAPSPGPRESDLVVAPHGPRWAVGPFGSQAQVSFATLDVAIAHARAFAAARGLDVWLTRDGVVYSRDRRGTAPGPGGG